MSLARTFVGYMFFALGWAERLDAVIFMETGDPAFHTSTPGDNSGWQYVGVFHWFLGVPIGPYHFITAKHLPSTTVGMAINFHGELHTTVAYQDCPGTDLRIWEVDHAKPFQTYAPLSSGAADIGATATVFGRGTQRGVEVVVSGEPKGWKWGTSDGVERWGRNVVDATADGGTSYGELLMCNFDNPGVAGECHLSTGDSGGGMFVLENGLWRLAGVNLGVDGPFRENSASPSFHAALFDVGGMEYTNDDGATWIPVPEDDDDVQSSFYVSRVSASLAWIQANVPGTTSLSNESYAAWQTLYFSLAQITSPATTSPLADFDADGVGNLLEFALNLDPTFSEQATMTPATGLRGLPSIRLENISGSDRLTIEFVRRTSGSGSGLTYTPQFSSDLEDWQPVGTETVTAINPRWDRVKIVDTLTTNDTSRRFARLEVAVAD